MINRSEVILSTDEPGPFELVRPDANSPIVLVCDHASYRVPQKLKDLGLNAEQLQSHIGWDIGAADLARELSSKLDATLVLSNYSRLVIDCNRWPRHPESIPAQSAGITIPGNALVSDLDVMHRRRALFEPYQLAIANVLGQRKQADIRLLSIHSFTPVLNGSDRPWSIGVCFGDDEGWAKQLASALRAQIDEPVGINQPYSVEAEYDYTIPVHGDGQGIPSLMLEIRQDKLGDDLKVQRWGNVIRKALATVLGSR